ncbi:MAG: hypothetical protein HFH87_17975, partial [Lachnospiraceae bacterium]|nr:hypothetical protein [Lachnospiraceae bacterium]
MWNSAVNKGGTALMTPFADGKSAEGFLLEKKGEKMSKELAKTYDPKGLEDRLYEKWLSKKYF